MNRTFEAFFCLLLLIKLDEFKTLLNKLIEIGLSLLLFVVNI